MFPLFNHLIVHFQKSKNRARDLLGFFHCFLITIGEWTKKDLDLEPSPPNHANFS